MKSCLFNVLSLIALMIFTSTVSAQGVDTHSAYKITSYNLGSILETQEGGSANFPENFRPLLITSTATDVLNSEHEGASSWVETNSHPSNTRGIALSAQFNATERLSLQGTFGVTKNLWTPDNIDYEQESSWEANLGVVYRFLDNLSYELHFGYMDTGDLFIERNTYSDVESIIMVSNRLTLSF